MQPWKNMFLWKLIDCIRIPGIGLELACTGGLLGEGGGGGGNIIKKRYMQFAFEDTPRVSLGYKPVLVQYREYKS